MQRALQGPGDEGRDSNVVGVVDPTVDDEVAPEQAIRCARCGHEITRRVARTARSGAHAHDFVNPAGIVFRVRCFDAAPGVRSSGERSGFWSWFPGYDWQVVLCGGCGAHLGWAFYGADPFWGLVADALVEG